MDFLELPGSERPQQIDIYVDGSRLHKGKLNLERAGGWGAVVVETYKDGHQDTWSPSGPVEEKYLVEDFAILHGLRAVQERESQRSSDDAAKPKIILHTDQASLARKINRAKKQLAAGHFLTKLDIPEKLEAIMQLVTEMDVKMVYASDQKSRTNTRSTDSPFMSDAHDLARKEAWGERIIAQGGKVFSHGHIQKLDTPEKVQDFLEHLSQRGGNEPGR